MVNIENLVAEFRTLRHLWFNNHLKSYAQERVWEDEEQEAERNKRNEVLKARFDFQTQGIIEGIPYKVGPICSNDLNYIGGVPPFNNLNEVKPK